MEQQNAPARELEKTERDISGYKEEVKRYETEANERERKLNQLLKEGLF